MISISAKGKSDAGFSLLELVTAITLFAFIVIYILADREKAITISADARIIQTVRYLAMSKIDELRHDPELIGDDGDSGDFSDLNNDWQDFTDYTWEAEVERVIAVGSSEEDDEYLFPDDEDEDPPQDKEGNPVDPKYVRRMILTIRFEPDGQPRNDLSIKIVTFLPPGPDPEEDQP